MNEPIACSLNPADMAARKAYASSLARDALRSRKQLAEGVRLTFAADDAIETRVREIVAAEARCCPFLTMALTRDGELLRLDVTGPADAQPIIAELFV